MAIKSHVTIVLR